MLTDLEKHTSIIVVVVIVIFVISVKTPVVVLVNISGFLPSV